MAFFGQFLGWLNDQLHAYIGANTATVANAIEPLAVTFGTLFVMAWGVLHIEGMIKEPLMQGVKRILVFVVVIGVGIRLWEYHAVISDTFFNAPDRLAGSIVGAPTSVSVIDQVWRDGNHVAEQLLRKGSVLSGDFSYYLAGFIVYLLVGMTVVYTAFLFALSKVAIAVILTLGPLFIVFLLFDTTKRFFEAWIAQLANYSLVTVLSTLIAALLLSIVKAYAEHAAAQAAGITIAESIQLCVASALVFLVMRQVMPIAAGLASGIALSSFGAVSGAVDWGLGTSKRTAYELLRGGIDGWSREPISRWDSLRRGMGNKVGSGLANVRDRATGARTGGTLVPRERVMPKVNGMR